MDRDALVVRKGLILVLRLLEQLMLIRTRSSTAQSPDTFFPVWIELFYLFFLLIYSMQVVSDIHTGELMFNAHLFCSAVNYTVYKMAAIV